MNCFLTFGTVKSHNTNYKNGRADHASKRLEQQAIACKMFDTVYRYDEFKLFEDKQWRKQHHNFADSNPRGFGYWIWKPYLIHKHIERLSTGDVFIYADGGCEIIPETYDHLAHLLKDTSFDVSVSLPTSDGELDPRGDYSNKKYCKSAVLKHFDLLDDKTFLDTEQYQASCQIIRVSDKTKQLIKLWLDTCSDYHLLDDRKNGRELNCFVDHRHDQAIYSILLSKSDCNIDTTLPQAIKINRNRTGFSKWGFHDCDIVTRGYFRAYTSGDDLYIDNDGGFFAACSVRLHNIVSFISIHKKLPTNVFSQCQFNRFRPDEMKYRDITYDFFEHYNDVDVAMHSNKISFAHNHQWRDFTSLPSNYLVNIKPVMGKYFSPTREIQNIVRDIENEYEITSKTNNYKNACVVLHRGTDKQKETHIPTTQEVIDQAKKLLETRPNMVFIIQSDESEFIDCARREFKNNCIVFDSHIRTMKSIPNKSLDLVNDKQTNYEFIKKYIAITNIIAKCNYAIIEAGNCGFWMLLYRGHNKNIIQYTREQKWVSNI